jgi:DNA (cytosine-5)-methyltransferase 1
MQRRHRPPTLQLSLDDELVVDNFAGGGGASTGIEAAIGRHADIAINHDPEAIAMHRANHPWTKHYVSDIWEVDPKEACAGRPVGLAWFSPDCRHFSRAKGQAPVSKKIRGLAWVVIRWAQAVRPRVIVLENVEEFQTWGPLLGDRPDPKRMGATFRRWVRKLEALGYAVEWRALVAADYGAPTLRRRLYLVARRDGRPIVWPAQTHGIASFDGKGSGDGAPWRTAAEVIDWSVPCPSIFDRARPLAPNTLRRIAKGVERFVIGAQQPFIVRHGHYVRGGAGDREGAGAGTWRGQPLTQPLATVCATNDKNLVVPFVVKHYGGVVGHDLARPLGTITGKDHHALGAAFITKFYGTSTGQPAGEPLHTVTGNRKGGGHLALVDAFLRKHGLAGAELPSGPVRDRSRQVAAFLTKWYGNAGTIGQDARTPLHTITSKARFALVEVCGEPYRIVDIGMRMLTPRELYRAQGFPDDYEIECQFDGRPLTKTAQIRMAGNSVCPDVAQALVAANVGTARAFEAA